MLRAICDTGVTTGRKTCLYLRAAPPPNNFLLAVRRRSSGKTFAISRQRMADLDVVYWPDSPDAPAREWEDVGAFLERMRELTGESGRRLRGPVTHRPPARQKANDGRAAPPKIEIVLYVSAASAKSQKALRAIKGVLDMYVSTQVKFSTCDLSQRPQDGEVDSVVFTPTLVKQGPGPRTSIIGNLDQQEILKDLLDASGVDRRRWDD
jgi:circadian clock protein KaiB